MNFSTQAMLPDSFEPGRWVPPPDSEYRVDDLMADHGIESFQALVHRSASEPEWFYRAAFAHLGLDWIHPFDSVVNASDPSMAEWFSGGKTNVSWLCVDRWARSMPDSVAVVGIEEDESVREITWAQLDDKVRCFSAGLKAHGIGRRSVVAIHLPMTPEAAITLLGIARIGAIALPLFSGYSAAALSTRLRLGGADMLVTADATIRGGRVIPMLEAARSAINESGLRVKLVAIGDELTARNAGATPWADLLDHEPEQSVVPFSRDQPFLLGFTSGSTGAPKGVVHVHGGFPYKAAIDLAYGLDVSVGDRFTWVTDMGWITGPLSVIGPMSLGATTVMLSGLVTHPSPDRLWNLARDHQLSHIGVSPTLVRHLIESDAPPRDSIRSLKAIGITGEPCTPDVWTWLHREVGQGHAPVINWTGGAEMGAGILMGSPAVPTAAGRFAGPCLGVAADVFNREGEPVVDEAGELVITKPVPSMTRSLWRDNARYQDTYWSRWPGVWVHGDVAIRHADHSWELPGRSDDVINVAGKRIGPSEIEHSASQVSGVALCAAVGIPHKTHGEAIAVVVVSDEDSDSLPRRVEAQVVHDLGRAFRPEMILVVPELPLSLSGKIQRRVLRSWLVGDDPGDTLNLANPNAGNAIKEVAHEHRW